MDAEKSTNQEPELQPSQLSENEASSGETETDVATAVTQNGEIEQGKVSNETSGNVEEVNKEEKPSSEAPDKVEEVNKQAENATEVLETESKVSKEESKKPDSRPTRSNRAIKRKANDADENENMNNTDTNESIVEQKENVDVKSQDSEPKENETVKG